MLAIVLKTFRGYFKSQQLIKNSKSVSKPLGSIEKKFIENNEEQSNPRITPRITRITRSRIRAEKFLSNLLENFDDIKK